MVTGPKRTAAIIWWCILGLVVLWTIRMLIGLATFDPGRYIGLEFAFFAVTIVSLPLCLPPLILGWVGRSKDDVKFGIVGLLWFAVGLAILVKQLGFGILWGPL